MMADERQEEEADVRPPLAVISRSLEMHPGIQRSEERTAHCAGKTAYLPATQESRNVQIAQIERLRLEHIRSYFFTCLFLLRLRSRATSQL